MYYNFIHLKKKFPKLYNFAKQAKRKLYFDKNFIENLKVERLDLIKSIKTESYIDYKKKQYDKTKGTISKVGILEINNSCNINCVMCDTKSSTRQKMLMNQDLFEKSVKEMKDQGINSVMLHTIGDPLANVRLSEYLKILRKYKVQTGISTNGLMLYKHVDTLIEYFDVCSNIRFSIDGVRKETYERIRFGGKFDDLIFNMDLAQEKLKKIGYNFVIDFVMNKENFSEIGEFIIFFKRYIENPFSDMHFNFMNSLSPSNTYFNKNNLLENMTFKNYYCNYASFLTPYILADGRISACCRDYDGSLVLSDIKTNKLSDTTKLDTFKDLQSFHEDETKDTNKFNLCRDCFVVDERISDIWNKTICIFLFKYPNKSEQFYQDFFDSFLSATLKDLDHMDEIFKAYSVN